MDAIQAIASKYRLLIIEDACQSHGATYKKQVVGSFGTGAFSLYPTKNMTAGEGGMITTNDSDLAEHCRMIRQHGMRRRYYHDELGFNFRMTDIQAAIGHEQLKKLGEFNRMRRINADYLSSRLTGVTVPVIPEQCEHVFHQYTIRLPGNRREALIAHLSERGVGSMIYYPVPVHQQSFYTKELGYNLGLPETELASTEVLSLPVHPGLSQSDLETIVAAVNEFSR
jgi:dTDP-4-amino-4,6-dideoxygalactose transaminase